MSTELGFDIESLLRLLISMIPDWVKVVAILAVVISVAVVITEIVLVVEVAKLKKETKLLNQNFVTAVPKEK